MVLALAVARNGKLLATGGPDESVYVWDAATGGQVRRFESPGPGVIPHLEFSADAAKLLVAGGGKAALWSLTTGEGLTRFSGHAGPVTAALSPGGRLAATANEDTTILVWDLADKRSESRRLRRQPPVRTRRRPRAS